MLKSVKYQKGKICNNMVTQLLLCAELKSITNTESLSSPPIFPPLNPSSKKVFKGAFPINWILGGKCLVIYVFRFDVSISASDKKKEERKAIMAVCFLSLIFHVSLFPLWTKRIFFDFGSCHLRHAFFSSPVIPCYKSQVTSKKFENWKHF